MFLDEEFSILVGNSVKLKTHWMMFNRPLPTSSKKRKKEQRDKENMHLKHDAILNSPLERPSILFPEVVKLWETATPYLLLQAKPVHSCKDGQLGSQSRTWKEPIASETDCSFITAGEAMFQDMSHSFFPNLCDFRST